MPRVRRIFLFVWKQYSTGAYVNAHGTVLTGHWPLQTNAHVTAVNAASVAEDGRLQGMC
jgi:hypothetical protein